MRKQGFILVELMVAVVLIGILAAIAVPKIFCMAAASKASEVGPAAGAYVKLQDAYVCEQLVYGGWGRIGFRGLGEQTNGGTSSFTTNFSYGGELDYYGTTTEATAGVWHATNRVAIDDCAAAAGTWYISTLAISAVNDGVYDYDADYFGAGINNEGDCGPLTPTFKKIATAKGVPVYGSSSPSRSSTNPAQRKSRRSRR